MIEDERNNDDEERKVHKEGEEKEGGGRRKDNGPSLKSASVSLAGLDLILSKQEVFLMVW